ncbi:conserved hypothetical protein [Gloeothece citriformis PCC 7424]|uniref:DUF4058 domain-containing protein n=1 Tax=Gloeothece citriformis (strain PCC 7424) TaxID=65393 RepID=B7KFY2_GLOC7|nr:DUF4058 family protein [Gloeothece citriformis]ACK69175.1 conserved hypothetical protein [Gloeothece citriformis PCC 7424]
MPSPFPGMDPYLEHPDFWPEVHHWLITAIAEKLVPQIRPKYEIAINKRVYTINDGNKNDLLVGIPDVTIKRPPKAPNTQSNVAVISQVTKPITVTVPIPEEIKQAYLEVREMGTGSVITAIEILSPVNKRPGEGRKTYLKKRQQVLGSLTHLIEIDLLRGGEYMPILDNPFQTDYRILISEESKRPKAELYAFNLSQPLPSFSVPLQKEDQEAIINLQQIFNEIYDRAGFDYRIDYQMETIPPIREEDQQWVKQVLEQTPET